MSGGRTSWSRSSSRIPFWKPCWRLLTRRSLRTATPLVVEHSHRSKGRGQECRATGLISRDWLIWAGNVISHARQISPGHAGQLRYTISPCRVDKWKAGPTEFRPLNGSLGSQTGTRLSVMQSVFTDNRPEDEPIEDSEPDKRSVSTSRDVEACCAHTKGTCSRD